MSVIEDTRVMSHLKISRNEICSKINILVRKYQISQTFKKRTDVRNS
jgi:hypothetical protein